MKICRTKAELRETMAIFRKAEETTGLVPTMGYLHEGHMTLVRSAKAKCQRVVASIFVNPTQFGDSADLDAYPRDEARDFALLDAQGVDVVFAPEASEVYDSAAQTTVVTEKLADMLMGALRPDHYKGVCTIVNKLFNLVQPDMAFFGEKDFQQLLVIKTMVRDLDIPVDVIGVPTVREVDGLAMSSRNVRLSPEDRQAALVLNRALAYGDYEASDGRDAAELEQDITTFIAREPRAHVESVDVRDAHTLEVPIGQIDSAAVILLAVRFGNVLLIDQRVCDPS